MRLLSNFVSTSSKNKQTKKNLLLRKSWQLAVSDLIWDYAITEEGAYHFHLDYRFYLGITCDLFTCLCDNSFGFCNQHYSAEGSRLFILWTIKYSNIFTWIFLYRSTEIRGPDCLESKALWQQILPPLTTHSFCPSMCTEYLIMLLN